MTAKRFRTISLSLSAALAVASIVAIATIGLNIGIDFMGGQLLELRFTEPTTIDEVRSAVEAGESQSGLIHATVAQTSEDSFLLRTAVTEPANVDALEAHLKTSVGSNERIRFEQVGPTVGQDLTRKAILGVILASLGIILYIAWAFRRVPAPTNSWRFGLTAIVALIHDLLITVGAFSVLGYYFGFEVDSLFITALLTVLGFSVHDTIVTYDRIRENLLYNPTKDFESVVTASIAQTIVRSLNTSLTLVLVLLALLVLGGSTIRPFIATLTIGVSVGTYSSIFVAAQLLVVWQNLTRKARS